MRKILLISALVVFAAVEAQEKFEVYFDFDQDRPTDSSAQKMNSWLGSAADFEVLSVSGFADSVGVLAYNIPLSQRRARRVTQLLRSRDIVFSPDMKIMALGEAINEQQQSRNRRVEILFRKKSVPSRQTDVTIPSGESAQGDQPDKPEPNDIIPAEELNQEGLSEKVRGEFANAKKGDVIRIHNINFHLNQEKVMRESEPVMQDLLATMKKYPGLRIEIHGHMCCNPNTADTKLSYRRAKVIFDFLRRNGVPLNRLAYKGFGSARPIFAIPEKQYGESLANRRVEILIVATNVK